MSEAAAPESIPHSIGILGGTFNPPHRGHLALARHARVELGLERVLLMPAYSAPHKGDEEDPGPDRRLEMCRLAVGERRSRWGWKPAAWRSSAAGRPIRWIP